MTRTRVLQIALLLAVGLAAAPLAQAKDKEPNFVQSFLDGVTIGTGQITDELIIFPLVAKEKPAKLNVTPSTWAEKIGYSEPEFPKRRYNLAVASNDPKPLLLLGGTVLGGGKRDRVAPQDVLVASGARVEIRTIPASPPSENRKTALPFRLGSALAPPYIRERAQFNPTGTLVPNFVSHFLDFRNEGDKRKSLGAINASTQLNKLCLPCHESLAAFPTASDGKVVGLVTAVRGRIRSFEAFGDNRLFKAWFQPLLKSHTFAAAAIAAKAKRLRLPVPGKGDPTKALAETRKKAEKLLAAIQKGSFRENDVPKGSIGDALIVAGTAQAQRALVDMAGSDPRPERRDAAAVAMFSLQQPTAETVRAVRQHADSSDTSLLLLGAMTHKTSDPELVSEMLRRQPGRGEAGKLSLWLRALGNAQQRELAESAISWLDHGDRSVRLAAIDAVGSVASAETRTALTRAATGDGDRACAHRRCGEAGGARWSCCPGCPAERAVARRVADVPKGCTADLVRDRQGAGPRRHAAARGRERRVGRSAEGRGGPAGAELKGLALPGGQEASLLCPVIEDDPEARQQAGAEQAREVRLRHARVVGREHLTRHVREGPARELHLPAGRGGAR